MSMRTGIAIILIGSSLASGPAQVSGADDSAWNLLSHVTRSRDYWLVDRGFQCSAVKIVSVTPQSVVVEPKKGVQVTIERKNLLRLGEFRPPGSAVYSGRSSWEDVKNLRHGQGESAARVKVLMRDGKQYSGKLIEVTDTRIKVSVSDKNVELDKTNVAQIFNVRFKPMTPGTEYAYDELGYLQVLDPALWPYLLNAAPKIDVRLYDSSMPEENSPVVCRNASPPR